MSTMAFAEKLVTILPGFLTCKFLFTSDNLLLLRVKIYNHLIYLERIDEKILIHLHMKKVRYISLVVLKELKSMYNAFFVLMVIAYHLCVFGLKRKD